MKLNIFSFQTIGELEHKIEERRTKVKNLSSTIQPFLVIVGESEAIYVVIDSFKYKLNTAVEGFDVCFKSFFALGLQYPPESKQVWMFIQKFIFKIETIFDINYSGIAELEADLYEYLL